VEFWHVRFSPLADILFALHLSAFEGKADIALGRSAMCDCCFEAFLDSGVFAEPEYGKPRKRFGVYLIVTDISEPSTAPVARNIKSVAHRGVHVGV
jgi:hypothetical protein